MRVTARAPFLTCELIKIELFLNNTQRETKRRRAADCRRTPKKDEKNLALARKSY